VSFDIDDGSSVLEWLIFFYYLTYLKNVKSNFINAISEEVLSKKKFHGIGITGSHRGNKWTETAT